MKNAEYQKINALPLRTTYLSEVKVLFSKLRILQLWKIPEFQQ